MNRFNDYLAGKKYWTLDRLTVCDFCFIEHYINGTVMNIDYATLYPNVLTYIKGLMKEISIFRDDLASYVVGTTKLRQVYEESLTDEEKENYVSMATKLQV